MRSPVFLLPRFMSAELKNNTQYSCFFVDLNFIASAWAVFFIMLQMYIVGNFCMSVDL